MREHCPIVVLVAIAMAGAGSLVSAGLIPGGGPKRTDCYVEASVQGIDSPGPQVKSNRVVVCTDGDPCDADGTCGNDSCTLRVAVCVDQKDPNLTACTPASSLQKLRVNAKLQPSVPASLSGSACGSFVDLTVPVRVKRDGKKRPGMLALSANATAEKGTKPARDRDKYVLECVPCGATTTTTLPGSNVPTVTVGPGGALRFDPKMITIHAGDTVRWHWDSGGHNVVSGSAGAADGMFCSPGDQGCSNAVLSASGTTYEHTFAATGTFHYFCSAHQSLGMTGTVIVEP